MGRGAYALVVVVEEEDLLCCFAFVLGIPIWRLGGEPELPSVYKSNT